MRSPTRTGEECPGGRSVFQITFFVGPNSTGRLRLLDTPAALGPRNCGQSSAQKRTGETSKAAATGRSLSIKPRTKTIQEIPARGISWPHRPPVNRSLFDALLRVLSHIQMVLQDRYVARREVLQRGIASLIGFL